MEAAVGELSLPPVDTCDGEALAAPQARRTARLYFWAGFACLPWFWACNIWLFFPEFWHGRDPVVAKCAWCRGGRGGAFHRAPLRVESRGSAAGCCWWGWCVCVLSGLSSTAGRLLPAAHEALLDVFESPTPPPATTPQTRGGRRSGLWSTHASSCPGFCST